jgi:hypothetical protein
MAPHLVLEVHLLTSDNELLGAVRSGVLSSEELDELICEACGARCGLLDDDMGDSFVPLAVVIDRTSSSEADMWFVCEECAVPVVDPPNSDWDGDDAV